MSGDILYIRAGSQKSIAHEDEEATAIKDIFNEMESGGDLPRLPIQRSQRRQLLRKAGEEDGADLLEEPFPDIEPNEIPGEEVHSEEAGRPPDPPERESEEKYQMLAMTARQRWKAKERQFAERMAALSKLKPLLSRICALIVIAIRIAKHAFVPR